MNRRASSAPHVGQGDQGDTDLAVSASTGHRHRLSCLPAHLSIDPVLPPSTPWVSFGACHLGLALNRSHYKSILTLANIEKERKRRLQRPNDSTEIVWGYGSNGSERYLLTVVACRHKHNLLQAAFCAPKIVHQGSESQRAVRLDCSHLDTMYWLPSCDFLCIAVHGIFFVLHLTHGQGPHHDTQASGTLMCLMILIPCDSWPKAVGCIVERQRWHSVYT